jgi:hypothetical protein
MRGSLCVFMFFENGSEVLAADLHMRGEGVRLWDFLDGLQIIAVICQREQLAHAIRPHSLDRR